jgi:5-methylcytosine-specific restriction endonuclease McrA
VPKLVATEEQDAEVWARFGGVCVVRSLGDSFPDCLEYADVIHEITPRSQDPKGWLTPENRVTLCHRCHWLVHNKIGTTQSKPLLRKGAAVEIARKG